MFNDKPYLEVNREERFFCALFGHALLSSSIIRERFVKLTQSKFGITLKPAPFEVFLEAAALRDYWNDLGDPIVYNDETHRKRRDVLHSLLSVMNVAEDVVDKHHLFWTSEQHRKLWSPGRWEPKALKEAGLPELIKLRWAFNAKPDILIVSDSNALMIEGKVESGEGQDEETGYKQLEIQRLITCLLTLLVPPFKEVRFTNTVLALHPTDGISWKEVLSLLDGGGLDDFSLKCLMRLRKFYD